MMLERENLNAVLDSVATVVQKSACSIIMRTLGVDHSFGSMYVTNVRSYSNNGIDMIIKNAVYDGVRAVSGIHELVIATIEHMISESFYASIEADVLKFLDTQHCNEKELERNMYDAVNCIANEHASRDAQQIIETLLRK